MSEELFSREEIAARAFLPYPAFPVTSAIDGPLKGLVMGVKDLFDVAGYPTGCGSPLKLALSGIKSATAPSIAKLLGAGAAFGGKTITDELAFSLTGKNAHFGTPVNPAAPERVPGGSSSGSASATAAGIVHFAIGSDTGGSVRGPASFCGVYGLRPTHGAISLEGAMALAPSLDTLGWFARDAATLKRVGDVLLPFAHADRPPARRLIELQPAFDALPGDVAGAFAVALKHCRTHFPKSAPVELPGPGVDERYWAFRRIQGYEAWAEHGATLTKYHPALGPGVRERFEIAATVTRDDYETSQRVRRDVRQSLQDLIEDDVLVLPTMPGPAPLIESSEEALDDYRTRALKILCNAGLSGFPQITIPVPGLPAPMGLSFLSVAGSDRALLDLAVTLTAR